MKDDYFRSKCIFPSSYDMVIDLIVLKNPYCKNLSWATNAVNNCIREVLNGAHDCETGGALAIASDRGVRLFYSPSCIKG